MWDNISFWKYQHQNGPYACWLITKYWISLHCLSTREQWQFYFTAVEYSTEYTYTILSKLQVKSPPFKKKIMIIVYFLKGAFWAHTLLVSISASTSKIQHQLGSRMLWRSEKQDATCSAFLDRADKFSVVFFFSSSFFFNSPGTQLRLSPPPSESSGPPGNSGGSETW